MVRVSFTSNIQRHVTCPVEEVAAASVREALTRYFERHPAAQDYILDEQRVLRKHVVIFIGDAQVKDRIALSDSLPEGADVYVMQALSGG